LLVMTLTGVTIMSGATLQERMAGNTRQLSLARLNAESALREAEAIVANLNIDVSSDPVNTINTQFSTVADHYYVGVVNSAYSAFDPVAFDVTTPSGWNTTPAADTDPPFFAEATGLGVTTAPRYVIEFIGEMSLDEAETIDVSVEKVNQVKAIPYAFRITAIGYGQDSNITAILQSIYGTVDNP
jgi:type IV pilus assembly protein PilX